MSGTPQKNKSQNGIPIAVFTKEFLGISATFIYRQLTGVQGEFNPCVITERTANGDIFPFQPVFSPPDSSKYRANAMEKLGAKIRRGLTGYYNLPGKAVYDFWLEKLHRWRPELLHAHFAPDGFIAAPLAEKLNIPLLVTLHGYDLSRLLNRRGYKARLRELFQKSARIITVSDKFRADAISLGCPADKVIRHYIGVPVDQFKYIERKKNEDEPLIFLQVSNFVEKKGHEFTIQAFARALSEGMKGRLILAGDGPTRSRCLDLAERIGVGEKIRFPGKKTMGEIPALMEKAHIFVHHSITPPDGDSEGIPTVIMEAMAAGLPVLTSSHAGIPELVIDGKSGCLTNERDVDGLARNMLIMANNPAARLEMGRFNRKRTEEVFNLMKQNEKLKSIYHSAIS